MKRKYYNIELLRFLSSIAVVLYHYKTIFYWSKGIINYERLSNELPFNYLIDTFYNFGNYGLNIFFIISGFVFATTYFDRNYDIRIKEFFLNRFSRLYPLHFIILIFFVVFNFFDKNFLDIHFNLEKNVFIDVYHFILNLFFIHSWGFEKGYSYNTPSWSISVEIGLYIMFFFTLKLFKKDRLFFHVVLLIIFYTFYKLFNNYIFYTDFAFLFYLGSFIYLIRVEDKKVLYFIISIILLYFSFYGNFKILLFCPSVLILTIIFETFLKNNKIRHLFGVLGNATYSSYLIHFPYMLLFLWIEKRYSTFFMFYNYNSFFFFFLISLIIISILCFKYFELPMKLKIRKKLI